MSSAPDTRTRFMRGVVDLLVLRALVEGPAHGRGVAERLDDVFGELEYARVGSMYARLRRLERSGWVRSEYGLSETRRLARFYRLTPAGWKHLEAAANDWSRFSGLVSAVLLGG